MARAGAIAKVQTMFEIRIHGRGGQGVVTAAELLSVSAFDEGRHAQAFPSFGSERTVTVAIGHAKRAARNIDAWLRGAGAVTDPESELAEFDALNTWYYADAPKTVRPELDAARRQSTFDEVVQGLSPDNALFEARRCLSCGSCFGCDNCYGVCPDNAVIKLEPGGAWSYDVDLDFCKGCGLCAQECPCGAIQMVDEQI
jgi:Pyruvate/2-oxoacid:ferredoxin oxidoreductase delta subunit